MGPELKIPVCPDHQIISLYLDRELPSPWKEKMENHLKNCPECRAVLSGYMKLGEHLSNVPAESIEAAQDRVWQKLSEQRAQRTGSDYLRVVRRPQKKIWNRSITLPLPLAAAAAVVIIIACFAIMGARGGSQPLPQNSMAVAGMGLNDYGTIPIMGQVPLQDMSDLLKYLSSQDNGDIMVIRLPESSKFSRTGEPALINAADYSRTRRNLPR